MLNDNRQIHLTIETGGCELGAAAGDDPLAGAKVVDHVQYRAIEDAAETPAGEGEP